MEKIVDINEYKPHRVSEVICINCKHRWIAVRLSTYKLKNLECIRCHQRGYVIETGEIFDENGN